MDKESLKAFHKAKNKQNAEKNFLDKCKKLEQEIAESEAKFNELPPLDQITDPHQRLEWSSMEMHISRLKYTLKYLKLIYTATCYQKDGINGIPVLPKAKEPGE